MVEEEIFGVNKTGVERNLFWRVFYYCSEEIISENYYLDVLKCLFKKIKLS